MSVQKVPGIDASGIATLSYEAALAELDELIAQLEAGSVDLSDAIVCYERAMRLDRHCSRLLDETERRAARLVDPSDEAIPEAAVGPAEPRGTAGLPVARVRREPINPDDIPF